MKKIIATILLVFSIFAIAGCSQTAVPAIQTISSNSSVVTPAPAIQIQQPLEAKEVAATEKISTPCFDFTIMSPYKGTPDGMDMSQITPDGATAITIPVKSFNKTNKSLGVLMEMEIIINGAKYEANWGYSSNGHPANLEGLDDFYFIIPNTTIDNFIIRVGVPEEIQDYSITKGVDNQKYIYEFNIDPSLIRE